MIYNIRGTSGSGKTSLVRQLVKVLNPDELKFSNGKLAGYRYPLPDSENRLYILGRYDDAIKGGGVDNITGQLTKEFLANGGVGNSMDAVEQQVRELAKGGNHVLFEGIIVTSVWGRWVRLAQELPVHFLFLDTPLEVCYQRVLERSGGRTPKGWNEGKSDLQAKHKNTGKQLASITRRDGEVKRQQSSLEDFYGRQTNRHLPAAVATELRHTVLHYETAYEELCGILSSDLGLGL